VETGKMVRSTFLVALLLVYALAFQGARGLYSPDEGRYTDVALEMVGSGDWIHPRLHPEVPHYTKPPLTYWVLATAFVVAGSNEWAARLPNSLAFCLTVWLVARLGRRFVPAQPLLPALLYASSLFPYLAANLVTTDTLLTGAETLSMLAAIQAWWSVEIGSRRRWSALAGVAAALAFLTKGPPGLLPLFSFVVFVASTAGGSGLLRLWSLRAFALFVVIGAWWYVKVALDAPELIHYFIKEEIWNRIAGS
jgi:4-amino-4-deoxy-L-arabinose transferase-like glycosyltransferase